MTEEVDKNHQVDKQLDDHGLKLCFKTYSLSSSSVEVLIVKKVTAETNKIIQVASQLKLLHHGISVVFF